MFDWVVPWTFADAVDFGFLVASAIVVIAVPVLYGLRANLRDPLARAVVAGTGSTALAFLAAVVLTVAMHAGWTPPMSVAHWITRSLYLTVALGKLSLLIGIGKALRYSRSARDNATHRGPEQVPS